jgi:hypothetical protein
MRIELDGVSKGRRGLALASTTLTFVSGEARLAMAETEQRPAVLGLLASGRMRPDTGSVWIDGRKDVGAIRRRVALIDAPDVCDPAPNVAVAGIVAEELMFAGRPSNPVAALRWLESMGMRSLARIPIADVAPRERIRILLELGAARAGIEGLVLVAPDRHGGDPAEWWQLAEEYATRGLAVLAIAGEASAVVLAERATRADMPAAEPEESPAGAVDDVIDTDLPLENPEEESR